MADPREVNVSRAGRIRQIAADASRDFLVFLVFVKGYLPSPTQWHCEVCQAQGIDEPEDTRCPVCGSNAIVITASHHEVIAERLLYGDRLELILGPPGSGKTSLVEGFGEWILGRNPNYRWLIASEVGTGIASTITSEIASTLEFSEPYRLCFGDLKDPTGRTPWSNQTFTIRPYISLHDAKRLKQPPTPNPPFPWLPPRGRDQRITGKHPSVKAVGWRYGYAGSRCEGILADDLVSDNISRSEKLTQQVFDTLHQKLLARPVDPVVPRGADRTAPEYRQHVVVLGQRWAPRDLFGMLIDGKDGHGGATTVFDNNPNRDGLWILDPDSQPPEVAA